MRVSRRHSLSVRTAALALLATLLVVVYYFYNRREPALLDVGPQAGDAGDPDDESMDSLHEKLENLERARVADEIASRMAKLAEPHIRRIRWIRYPLERPQIKVAAGQVANFSDELLRRLAGGPACDALKQYFLLLTQQEARCRKVNRFGRPYEGGWDICLAGPYRPEPDACVAMSFGVGNIWEFDDEVAERLRCRVLAFDPSLRLRNHTRPSGVQFFNVGVSSRRALQRRGNWTVDTFEGLADALVGRGATVDILKLDVEYSEWPALEAAAKSGALARVKQLAVEFHTKEVRPRADAQSGRAEYLRYIRLLRLLRDNGFRLWRSTPNQHGVFSSSDCSFTHWYCCYNNYYINVNYLPKVNVKEALQADQLHQELHAVRLRRLRLPNPRQLRSHADAERLYFDTMTAEHAVCPEWQRVGPDGDSGYDLCLAVPFALAPDCIVYSFGVGDQVGFEDQMAKDYHCQVRMFDPSTGQGDHKRGPREWFYAIGLAGSDALDSRGWEVRTLFTLLRKFRNSNVDIDVLKIDIEFDEWDALKAAVKDSSLRRVKQLLVETHTKELKDERTAGSDYLRFVGIWYDLYSAGFRQWRSVENRRTHFRSDSGHDRPCCHVHSLINSRYLSDF